MYEEERKRGEWKMGVVERQVRGRDNVARGATVRAVTKGNRFDFPDLFKTFIRWSFGAGGGGKEYKHLPNATGIKKFRQEESLLEMRP